MRQLILLAACSIAIALGTIGNRASGPDHGMRADRAGGARFGGEAITGNGLSNSAVLVQCSGIDDSASLLAAATSASGAWVVVTGGQTCAGSELTLANVRVEKGGLLKPLNGRTITISGNFDAGPYQTFTNALSGQGTVLFSPSVQLREVFPQWWGAVADSSGAGVGTDNTAAFQAAIIAGANRTMFLPRQPNRYRITSKLNISNPMAIVSNGATIQFDFPPATSAANGRLFDVRASSVEFRDLKIDGGGVVSNALKGNRYAIIADNGAAVYSNIKIQNVDFTNMGSYSGSLPATTNAMHAVYGSYTDNLKVEDCLFDTISGSAAQVNHATNTEMVHNTANKVGWYAFLLNASNSGARILNNTVKGSTAAAPVYWGGGIDLMGQTTEVAGGGAGDRAAIISGNYLTGTYKYTAALRLVSASHVTVADNIFDQCEVSSIQPDLNPVSYPANSSLIVVSARDVGRNNGPSNNITIHHNIAIARGQGQKFISATTTSGSMANSTKAVGLTVDHNRVVSVDSTNYFAAVLALSAGVAGYEDIIVDGNYFKGAPIVNVGANLYDGAVAFTATAGGPAQKITITNNQLSFFATASVPRGATASKNAIYLEQYCDGASIHGNTIDSFPTGLFLNTNSGLSLGIWGVGSDTLLSVTTPLSIADATSTKVFGQSWNRFPLRAP